MQHFTYALCVYWVLMGCHTLQSGSENSNALKVSRTEGLIAFWDFYQNNDTGHWISVFDKSSDSTAYPVFLRQISDRKFSSQTGVR